MHESGFLHMKSFTRTTSRFQRRVKRQIQSMCASPHRKISNKITIILHNYLHAPCRMQRRERNVRSQKIQLNSSGQWRTHQGMTDLLSLSWPVVAAPPLPSPGTKC